MVPWTPQIESRLADLASDSADALVEAFNTGLEVPVQQVTPVGESDRAGAEAADHAAIVCWFSREQELLAAVLQPADGESPAWFRQPDEAGQERLATLAARIAELLLPDDLAPADSTAEVVEDAGTALTLRLAGENACLLELRLKAAEPIGTLRLIAPTGPAEANPETDPQQPAAEAGATSGNAAQEICYSNLEDGVRQLPAYAKSLLKISVPVRVTLASTKLPIQRVLEFGPGSIIQFAKSCEDTLTLEVGDHEVASGEAVKVGDKFGLWITSIAMPAERFFTTKRVGSQRVK